MNQTPIRVLIAKPGLDGHDRGAKVVTLALRDAGFEVIYTGLHRTIEEIVDVAVQEDVDVIGMSVLSGAHLQITARLIDKMKAENVEDKLVILGGNIPEADIPALAEIGARGIFPTGSRFDEIAAFIRDNVKVHG